MKSMYVLLLAFTFASCNKTLETNSEDRETLIVSNDALQPIPCKATIFSTNYPIVAGKVPPFSMSKTLYADGRVNTIKMVTRAVPNLPANAPKYYEWNYKFTYSPNKATMNGTRKLYAFNNGVRYVAETLTNTFYFLFNPAGYCTDVYRFAPGQQYSTQLLYENNTKLTRIYNYDWVEVADDGPYRFYIITSDSKGNPTRFRSSQTVHDVRYTYNVAKPAPYLLYQPTQYALNQWYGFLEAMQWVPMPKYERVSVALTVPSGTSSVLQVQKYINHKYDLDKKLLSYTYLDNVLQKTTWVCK
jgi:hypothetical protein